jgi:branched-chain amino acid transport system ATP-binding protein
VTPPFPDPHPAPGTDRAVGDAASAIGQAALETTNLAVRYRTVQAVRGVSLAVPPGQMHALIGPNGAGKTSLLRAIAGLTPAHAGTVVLDGQDVTRMRTERRAKLGLTLVPEGRGMFPSMSVEENLLIAARHRRAGSAVLQDSYDMFPLLVPLRRRAAGLLSGGEQQTLALARALVLAPRALLLDEPTMGLAPVAVAGLMEVLRGLGNSGPGVLLVEQNARVALELASYVYVMQQGQIATRGLNQDISGEKTIARLYFGG